MTEQLQNESDTFDIGGETVHRLGFGAMRLTGEDIIGPPADEENATDVIRHAIDLGVDFIDTADSYGPGVSERLLGEALTAEDDVFVASKAGLLRHRDGEWTPHGDPEYLHNQVLASLDRLRTDQIDLYQFHRPDPDGDFEDSVQAFAEMKDAGQIEHVGLSNVTVEQLETAMDIVDVATVQNQYNVGHREDEAVLEACESYDVGFIPWGPMYTVDDEGVAEVLDEVGAAHDATRRQIALAWLLDHSDVMLPIPGTSSVEHLEANVAATTIDLTDEDRAALDGIDPQ
ncbi:1-deoxy-D-xylulose-5-phosphate reductoisomerase protein [Halorhabdus tiamatea SARL4B]|uniref:1-deoxy-D-xylulose-5-phosphate reductoisomerase protein n=1 Tax=Halorhabdus tiamatea SARL4B TaxID=1033806 RepID=F7PNW3_9EURY|nr:aldo/keto reductase [Halorhabdus tiamatea]ERJ06723.1 1-deoxy-D-xylulose-5-phosphate reductoisomerase protein [Halorhabdus tiamatea SARL4B]CCQ33645.1 aldo/keto reductase family oxidoreductase [Halorhabdus tiamatea SARL4B]